MKQARIIVNEEGAKAIDFLLDTCLKHWGLQTYQSVTGILNSVDLNTEYFDELEKKQQAEAEKENKK